MVDQKDLLPNNPYSSEASLRIIYVTCNPQIYKRGLRTEFLRATQSNPQSGNPGQQKYKRKYRKTTKISKKLEIRMIRKQTEILKSLRRSVADPQCLTSGKCKISWQFTKPSAHKLN